MVSWRMPTQDSQDLLRTVTHWPFVVVLTRMGMAMAVGVLVGLEREHSQKTGARTFALISLLGCLGGLMGDLFAGIALGFVALVVVGMNYRQMVNERKLALTTTTALSVIAFTGVLFGQGHVFTPVAAGVATAALLAWKERISSFAVGLSDQELRSAILLAILTFIIYPVLPEHPVDPWGLIEPRSNWASVIIIAGIGFVNYILLKTLGPRGMEITAFFGGLVNSRKVIVELATRFSEIGPSALPMVRSGVILATGAMLLRNALIVGVLAGSALIRCLLPLSLMLATSAIFWRRITRQRGGQPAAPLVQVQSPFKLSMALKFGLVFLALNVAGALAQRSFGSSSFYFVSIAGGLLSSASSIAAAATLMARGEIPVNVGVNGIVLSTLTSIVANIPLIRNLTREPLLRRHLCFSLIVIAAVGLLGVFLNDFLFARFFGSTP